AVRALRRGEQHRLAAEGLDQRDPGRRRLAPVRGHGRRGTADELRRDRPRRLDTDRGGRGAVGDPVGAGVRPRGGALPLTDRYAAAAPFPPISPPPPFRASRHSASKPFPLSPSLIANTSPSLRPCPSGPTPQRPPHP